MWHEAQLPLTSVWSTCVTGRHENVAWQAPQDVLERMCVVLLPVARVPSWQAAQDSVTPVCEKLAGCHCTVVWQLSQALSDRMCVAFLPVATVPS